MLHLVAKTDQGLVLWWSSSDGTDVLCLYLQKYLRRCCFYIQRVNVHASFRNGSIQKSAVKIERNIFPRFAGMWMFYDFCSFVFAI